MFTKLYNTITTFLSRQKTFNKTYRELSKLSDRDLFDIGINRGDIEYIAREDAQQKHK